MLYCFMFVFFVFFFFNDTTTTEIYTLSLHDALPIFRLKPLNCSRLPCVYAQETLTFLLTQKNVSVSCRSEERFSRNAETDLVCRLLLEKKKKTEAHSEWHDCVGSVRDAHHPPRCSQC